MKTISISWDSLSKLSYKEENRTELLVWTLINAGLEAQKGFMDDEMIYFSLDGLWDLITFGENSVPTKQKSVLVESLVSLHKKELIKIITDVKLTDIKFTTKLKIKVNYTQNKPFTNIRNDELSNIMKLKFTDISLGLCAFFRITSHGGKHYYYQDLNYLVKEWSHQQHFELDNEESWFVGMTKEDLKDVKNVIYYPNKDEIIVGRFSGDKDEEQWTTRPTLDKILKELHKVGVLSEIETHEGLFGNKIVFCKTQHEKLVNKYYERVTEQKEFSSSNNKDKKVKQPTKKPVKSMKSTTESTGTVSKRERPKFR